jgi:tetratricopeptide (TPR) repeat protein
MAEALGRAEGALAYWRRAVAADPWAPEYRRRLALLLVRRQAWAEAEPACRAWVRLDPTGAEARAALVECLLAAGRRGEARAEFARVEALAPPNLRALRIRLGRRLR